jgi:hypothetical protein
LLRRRTAFPQETACQDEIGALRFQPPSQDFQPAIGLTSRAVEEAHEIVKLLGSSACGAPQVKSEGLSIFDSMPEVIILAVLISNNGNRLSGKIGTRAIAMEAFFEDDETGLNVAHFP